MSQNKAGFIVRTLNKKTVFLEHFVFDIYAELSRLRLTTMIPRQIKIKKGSE